MWSLYHIWLYSVVYAVLYPHPPPQKIGKYNTQDCKQWLQLDFN